MKVGSGIYEIRNLVNGHCYIGSSQDVRARNYNHRYFLRHGLHRNAHLQSAWNKYGEDAFTFCVLAYCDIDMLLYFEQKAIDIFHPEYNKSPTAVAHRGRPLSEEHRRKISEGNKGRAVKPETRKKIGDANRGRVRKDELKKQWSEKKKGQAPWNKGKKGVYSEDTLRIMGEKNARYPNPFLGKHHTEETRQKISAALTGRKLPPETVKKMKARTWSTERKVKWSAAMKGKPMSEKGRAAIRAGWGVRKARANMRQLVMNGEWT